MRASVLASLLVASLFTSSPTLAATDNIYLPPSPTGPGGEDSIETAEGTRCRQSMNSNHAYVDLGVSGRTERDRDNGVNASIFGNANGDSAVAYARITIPIGSRPKRIDCTRLYDLEIQRLRREIELLKISAE